MLETLQIILYMTRKQARWSMRTKEISNIMETSITEDIRVSIKTEQKNVEYYLKLTDSQKIFHRQTINKLKTITSEKLIANVFNNILWNTIHV